MTNVQYNLQKTKIIEFRNKKNAIRLNEYKQIAFPLNIIMLIQSQTKPQQARVT